MTIVFHTDSSVTRRGFKAEWTRVAGLAGGNILSPNYPGSYPNSYDKVRKLFEVDLQFCPFEVQLCQLFLICEGFKT